MPMGCGALRACLLVQMGWRRTISTATQRQFARPQASPHHGRPPLRCACIPAALRAGSLDSSQGAPPQPTCSSGGCGSSGYCGLGSGLAEARDFAEAHMMACLHAGVKVTGGRGRLAVPSFLPSPCSDPCPAVCGSKCCSAGARQAGKRPGSEGAGAARTSAGASLGPTAASVVQPTGSSGGSMCTTFAAAARPSTPHTRRTAARRANPAPPRPPAL